MFWPTAAHAQTFMPSAGTKIAEQVDSLYGFLVLASFVSCVLVIGGFIYFAIKYKRRSEEDKTAYITHNNALEFAWSFIPFVIFMAVFGWGWWIYDQMRSMPEDPLEVHVVGQKWYWEFLYKSGRKVTNEFYVPVNEPVKLIITSRDVLHSVFIPGFRIKQDAVPGRYTALWFEASKEGSFNMFCTEYCGEQHSSMLAKVNVLPKDEWEEWLRTNPYRGMSLAQIGQEVYAGKCLACHKTTAEKKIGPGFANLFGKSRQFQGGSQLQADANYIRESILNPNKKIVAGYPSGVMPTFAGQLSEQEVTGVIEYIKTLSE